MNECEHIKLLINNKDDSMMLSQFNRLMQTAKDPVLVNTAAADRPKHCC